MEVLTSNGIQRPHWLGLGLELTKCLKQLHLLWSPRQCHFCIAQQQIEQLPFHIFGHIGREHWR